MSELAQQLIAENIAKWERGEDASYLDLGRCGLTELPDISDMEWLEKLTVADEWWDWTQKKWMKSKNRGESNRLEASVIGYLPIGLKKLVWGGSLFDYWPTEDLQFLTPLLNLTSLYLQHNTISNAKPLGKLTKLKELSLWENQIIDIEPLEKLFELTWLDLYGNQISDVKPLEKLTKLTSLHLGSNQISDTEPLGKLHNLISLYLQGNPISDLAPLLPLIQRGLPVNWEVYENQAGVCLFGTRLPAPPPEIFKRGHKAILNYLQELKTAQKEDQVVYLAEAKCLIIGEGGSGKTSLVCRLLDREAALPGEEETTKGIEVHYLDWLLPDGTGFRLNLWDFGGQEIYHATHQFFLTKRSLYILLDDTRKDEKTVNDPIFNYWLQVVELYGGGSPLIIVQNEKGDRSKQLDLRGMQGRFEFVKDSKTVNLLTGRGLDDVWDAIQYWITELDHIGEKQPKVWLDIRQELEQLAHEEGYDHISLQTYYDICRANGMPERERMLFLSKYLHDFGAFLHFQDHPLLRKIIVLNNRWATDAVYRVLDCEIVKRAFGRFTRNELAVIWADDRYADQHDELLALMEKFELCYKLHYEKEDTWLAPQLLSALQPDVLAWDETYDLQLRYEYEFMPRGLLSQHIVRMHRYIQRPELVWKSGVVFERERSQVLVTEAWGIRRISIRARGPYAKELITLVSEDFDLMHARLEGLRVQKMIPCNCRICHTADEPQFYEYADLARRKERGKPTVECPVSYDDVPVLPMLDGFFAQPTRRSSTESPPLKLFISYSRHDLQHKDTLLKHLSGLRNKIVTWHDRDILPGEDWDERIKAALHEADVVLYLVTHNSLATEYIQQVELPLVEQRCAAGECILVPVIVDFCVWSELDFAKRNALPEKGTPVTDRSWKNENEAWVQVVEGVRRILAAREGSDF